jgi:hypothetical protein
MTPLFVLCLLLAGDGGPARPIVTAELATRRAFIGDAVAVKVRLFHAQGWTYQRREMPQARDKAHLLSANFLAPVQDPETGLMVEELHLQVAWYELGEMILPAMEFEFLSDQGEKLSLATPELKLELVSLREEGDEQTAPLKDQLDAPHGSPILWWLAGGLVLAMLLGLFFWLRRRKPSATVAEEPPLPPYEEACQALRALIGGGLLKEGKTKQFYVEINEIVRRLYARALNIPAEEMTTIELEEYFNTHHGSWAAAANSFQQRCDMVKFARYRPSEAENGELVNLAHHILEQFRPVEVAP